MNIDHLKLFVRIAATNNISLAGKEFRLSPAVSSTYINKLEESLGVRLVHRTTRRVSLTEEGADFLPHAQEILASIETARAAVGAGHIRPQGTLRITAPASFGRMHIVPALSGFMQTYPELNIDLRLSDSIIDLVEGGFDVAIRNSHLSDSSMIARKLASDKRVICASPSYLAQMGEPKKPEELLEHHCINLTGLNDWVFETPNNKAHHIKPKIRLRMDNGEAVRDACVNGLGISICSVWCAYQQLRDGELVEILTEEALAIDTAIWAVYPSSRLLAPKVRAFIDYFVQSFGDTPYWEMH